MNNAIENVRKLRNINLVTTKRRRNYLVSEPNYHTTNFFTENMLAIEIRKTQILMNKLVHLRLSTLNLSKTVMYEFWYGYVKPKYAENTKNLLYGYRQRHWSCKNRWYLLRCWRGC